MGKGKKEVAILDKMENVGNKVTFTYNPEGVEEIRYADF